MEEEQEEKRNGRTAAAVIEEVDMVEYGIVKTERITSGTSFCQYELYKKELLGWEEIGVISEAFWPSERYKDIIKIAELLKAGGFTLQDTIETGYGVHLFVGEKIDPQHFDQTNLGSGLEAQVRKIIAGGLK